MKRRTFLSVLLLFQAIIVLAQLDCKIYFANNIGDVKRLSRIKMNDSELKWSESPITDGAALGNRVDVEAVKKMFADTRQKTREDQKLFWKMRDDNLLCFRINDGKGTYGQYEVRVSTSIKDSNGKTGTVKKNVSSYFFVNCSARTDTLLFTVNKLGCSASPLDTLHFRYFIHDWDDRNLYVFKLDSRRRNTGLTYQLEYVLRNANNQDTRNVLELSGSSFQSFYVPNDQELRNVYLVSEGKNRIPLNMKRLVNRVNLSDKLNRLWLDDNFTLDKHENRELTIFNMLGSGLFEKYDTLSLQVLGNGGKPIVVPLQPSSTGKGGTAKGFVFHVAQVDDNGKYVRELKDSYVSYNAGKGVHKILTYGNPCYIEVIAPGHLPAVFKYTGARDPKDGVLSRDNLEGVLHLIPGAATATGPDVAEQRIYVLKNKNTAIQRDGKTYQVFSVFSEDLSASSSSSSKNFIEDGGWQKLPKLVNDKPMDKYAELGFTYSCAKGQNASNPTLTFVEKNGSATHTAAKTTSSKIDGNDYPCFQRSYYEQRWSLVNVLPKKDVAYKPRLSFSGSSAVFTKIPYIIREEYNQAENEKKGREVADSYVFKDWKPDGELNGDFTFLGKMGTVSIRGKDIPGLEVSVVPHIEPLKGIYDLDFMFSLGLNGRNSTEDGGGDLREQYRTHHQLHRLQVGGEFGAENKKVNAGVEGMNSTPLSKIDKNKWIQAELDDICRVELNKLGTGWYFDAHLGLGWNTKNNEAGSFQLKALEGTVGYGTNWALAGDFAGMNNKFGDFLQRLSDWMQFALIINAEANAQVSLGLRTYNYKRGDVITKRMSAFFTEVMGYSKAGFKLMLQSQFGETYGPSSGEYFPNMSKARRAATTLFNISIGFRAGAKLMLKYGIVWPFERRLDYGGAFMFFVGGDAFFDLRCPLFRLKADAAFKLGGRYIFFPDNANNPSNPMYPNYMGGAQAKSIWSEALRLNSMTFPRITESSLPDVQKFYLGTNIMSNLDSRACPQFLGDERFVITHNSGTKQLNDDRVKEYSLQDSASPLPSTEGKAIEAGDKGLTQNQYSTKVGNIDMVVCEEMTKEIQDVVIDNSNIDQLNELSKNAAIVAKIRTAKDGAWSRSQVSYDENLVDSKPVGAINVASSPGSFAASPTDRAVCIWKRGRYVPLLTEEEIAAAPVEQQAGLRDMVDNSNVRGFVGNLMLSIYDGKQWQQPQSILELNRDDVLQDYQVVMCNDTVLAAVTLMPQDRDSLELRYYCKPKDQPVKVYTDKMVPIEFSMDMVGSVPFVAILHAPDTTSTDIYVKAIDMEGQYLAYGADLDLEYHSPLSVKLVADKSVEEPEDFAIVWRKFDNGIRQDGKYLQTDSTQMMINCSRIFMDYNLTASPFITLGCSTDKTYLSDYDVFLNEDKAACLWTLTDKNSDATYLMHNEVDFYSDFNYSVAYSQEAMIDDEVMPVSLCVENTGNTPIISVEGSINDQEFKFDDLFISPYSSQTLTVEYELPDDFNGLLQAKNVAAIFSDLSYMVLSPGSAKASGASLENKVKDDDQTNYATGYSDVRCELLGQSMEGSKNTVYVGLTDYDGLNANETLYVGLYPDHIVDEPICNTAEVKLTAADFEEINGLRKANVILTADNLSEEVPVYLRARVYNNHVLESLGADDDILDAVVDNKSWYDNMRVITLLPSELDDITGLPVVTADNAVHKATVEKVESGVWISGLESDDNVRIFDAQALPIYLNRAPTNRIFVPLQTPGAYLLSTGQEVVKFNF